MKTLYMIWMVLGVVGFPASVGWLLHRWQKYAKAQTDKEKLEQRDHINKTLIFVLVFLVVLVSFILYSVFTQGAAA